MKLPVKLRDPAYQFNNLELSRINPLNGKSSDSFYNNNHTVLLKFIRTTLSSYVNEEQLFYNLIAIPKFTECETIRLSFGIIKSSL